MNEAKTQDVRPDSLLTSYQVGTLLQVNPSSVNKWIKDGRIPAFRTPGGHRRIKASDLVSFLAEHKMPIPPILKQAAKQRVLIVDDDNNHAELLQKNLHPFTDRIELSVVLNAVDALIQIGSIKPHLVVIDTSLKNMDGLEICKRLHQGQDTKSMQIIVVSKDNIQNTETERRYKEFGIELFSKKPLHSDFLLKALHLSE